MRRKAEPSAGRGARVARHAHGAMGACGRDAALLLHTHSHISPPSLHSATAVPRSYTLTRLSVCKCLQRNMSSNSIGAVRCDACMGHPAVALSSSPTRTCHVVTNISHVAIFSCISCPCGTTQTSLHPAAPHRPHARWTMVMIALYTHTSTDSSCSARPVSS